ncbi:replication initiator protein A [Candidatus Pseudoruminococcus sp.]|uniref:replication initiator protein A n=1 Tax=Candidatus Pseudoruminococcus sp. TaxID=3101048 RepID=UPI00399A4CCD
MFDFFYGNEAEQYQFYRVPQALFTNEKFSKISCESKLLYGFLLDRCGLSRKSKWYDEDGKLYVFFKQEEAIEKLNIGKNKAVKIFDELEQTGLIVRKKQGQGKPTKIYVCNFTKELADMSGDQTSAENTKEEVQTPENRESEISVSSENNQTEVQTPENGKSKLSKTGSQYIYSLNQTEMNQTNPSIYQQRETKQTSEKDRWTDDEITECEEFIKMNIDYDNLLHEGVSPNTLDMIVDIMLEAYNPQNDFIKIQGQSVSRTIALRQYEKLDSDHIRYILDSITEEARRKKIKNLRPYLKTCLYNAPHSIDMHYDNELQFDYSASNDNES